MADLDLQSETFMQDPRVVHFEKVFCVLEYNMQVSQSRSTSVLTLLFKV